MGSRIDFVAQFLGRRIAYTYEVIELVPGQRLVQATSEGPFPMEITAMRRANNKDLRALTAILEAH